MSTGELLERLNDLTSAPPLVVATYRVWWHAPRAHEAFMAERESRKRRGTTFGAGSGRRANAEPEPDEQQETVHIWRDGDTVRVEHRGGTRDGDYAVADPPLWWMWNHVSGAHTNQDDPSVGSGVGQEMELMLNPVPLLSAVQFEATGTGEIAGRRAITARAMPRAADERLGPTVALGRLGTGADHYELAIDAERGVLLDATAVRDGAVPQDHGAQHQL